MESYEVWDRRISDAATELGFKEGYKILYAPWSTIGTSDTVFLSLNPGRAPCDALLSTLSDERGNSYEVEENITRSPITKQFLTLAKKLSLNPNEILTGVMVPFRSGRWNDCTQKQRAAGLELGSEFWRQAFQIRRPRRVIVCGREPALIAASLLDAEFDVRVPSGWGKTSLTRFRALDGSSVIQLPHLSTFKLLSRPECVGPVMTIINGCH